MKIKRNRGNVIHQPLSYIFGMMPCGGSAVQKYDSDSATWVPNRAITPFVLQPKLLITDPEESLPTGDYTSRLTNVSWLLTSYLNGTTTVLTPGQGYTYNSSTKGITVTRNVQVGEVIKMVFSADYTDTRRNEVQHFTWDGEMTTEAQATTNISLDHGDFTSKMNLSPFKRWGQFGIPVQLKNGNNNVADADATYQWQWWNETASQWSSDFSSRLWYVSGANTKQIIVNQDYIGDILLRVKAYAYGNANDYELFTTRLRRWYGQYTEDIDILTGKYVFQNDNMVVLEGKVANKAYGNIPDPTRYFDMEMFFAVGNNPLESVAYGDEAILHRQDLQDGTPQTGILVRELSCFLPLADDAGRCLADDQGRPLVVQIPTSERETS